MNEKTPTVEPRCVATSGVVYQCSVSETQRRESLMLGDDQWSSNPCANESNIFKDARWPTDLLEKDELHDLVPFSVTPKAEPVYCTAVYPGFSLQGLSTIPSVKAAPNRKKHPPLLYSLLFTIDPSTTCFLTSTRDHPIHLQDALTPRIRGTYPLTSPTTEKFIAPNSVLWSSSGTKFICGSDALISVFDVSRVGAGPAERHPTIPSKRKKIVGGGVGMKGIVSALGLSDQTGGGILAAGTFTRMIGLYGSEGSGDCIAVFPIEQAGEGSSTGRAGAGITALEWSPCGRYLYVAERKSTEILVYDIRVAGRRLGSLTGRTASSNQRLGIHVVLTDRGHEVWAGCDDGTVRVWQNATGDSEMSRQPDRAWKAHDGPVAATIVHPSGTVVGTCSGQRDVSIDTDEGPEESDVCTKLLSASPASRRTKQIFDNTLKIWKI
ncbi:hypothetical protein FGG08_000142 [Glutinoglossum americanum]|uniref:Uncharacterized protein n=1 Tax=Glutinoglossum americanum TaxID=1670608 RepID=A0A9P8L687_9PEZI|nr:hypothetical protein FGG08_000142 [Glutinoglossum americanum]